MHAARWQDVEGKAVSEDGAKGVTLRVLMGDNVGAPTFTMRHFEIAPGGHTPFHAHPWEHEVYVLSGTGKVRQAEGEREVGPGSFVYVPPGEMHNFSASAASSLAFLCVIPSDRPCVK
jgi:quercetin dioxygenase-like cupin family protein